MVFDPRRLAAVQRRHQRAGARPGDPNGRSRSRAHTKSGSAARARISLFRASWHLTTKRDINVASFNLGSLVSRPAVGSGGAACARSREDPRRDVLLQRDGDATVCCWDVHGRAIIGNVNEQPVQAIWRATPRPASAASWTTGGATC